MNGIIKLSRRDFLKTGSILGGGLVLAWHLPFSWIAEGAEKSLFSPNAFLRIGPDESVTIIVNKAEMGQGVYTSLPMLLAEELECDWKMVRVEAAPVAPVYNHTQFGAMIATGGSTSVRSEWERLSKAGSTAREMLVAAAAQAWKVSPEACRAENSQVIGPDGKRLSYGKLADRASKLPVPQTPKLKDPAKRRLIGKPVHRLDSPAKINGTAVFGIDVQAPGMLTAVIARAPVFGGKVRNFDPKKALTVPGVKQVVRVDAGVVVVADGFWPARMGREQLEIVWDEGEWADLSTPQIAGEYARLAALPGIPARKEGDIAAGLARSVRRLKAEYEVPFLAHAPMEPLNCFVDLKADHCLIRTGTQFQTVDRDAVARELGFKPEQVTLETTFMGGGFGRRACPTSDFVLDAVQVAKKVGKPVKVIRTREDDMRAGFYRPMWYDRIEAGLGRAGKPLAWSHTIVGQSILAGTPFESVMIREGIDGTSVEGAADIPYAIPNILVDLHSPKNGVPVLWLRSVGHSHTAFVVQSFLDELAHAAGQDPYQYQRALLAGHPRHLGVLDAVAKKAGWGKPLPEGVGRGIALHESFGSYIAQVAEVSLDEKGRVRVQRVVCAIDCGRIVNPDTIAAQMESGIIFGLSAALYGAITLKQGRVEQGNFDSYPLVRMEGAPVVEVQIVPSTEAPGGVGEPGVPPIAPAVANALFAATGARVRSLPLLPEKIRAALGKG